MSAVGGKSRRGALATATHCEENQFVLSNRCNFDCDILKAILKAINGDQQQLT